MIRRHYNADVSVLTEKVEDALYGIAHAMNLHLLETSARENLLTALDALSRVWERFQQTDSDYTVSFQDARLVATVCEISRLACSLSAPETQRLSDVIARLVRGLEERCFPALATSVTQVTSIHQEQSAPPAPTVAPDELTPPAEPAMPEQATTEAPVAPSEAPVAEEPQVLEVETVVADTVAPQPGEPAEETLAAEEVTVLLPPKPQEVPYAGLAEMLDEIGEVLEDVTSRLITREQAVAGLMYAACLHRWLRSRAVHWHREWEVEQVKHQIAQLADEDQMAVWMPPFDPRYEFSDNEITTLRHGYSALRTSWQMWEWYQANADELDKGTGAPLLESIAAPIPMIQQIYNPKGILPAASAADSTLQLREEITSEAQRRRWKVEMLSMTCSRQRQLYFIEKALDNWETAKAYTQKKRMQSEALNALEQCLSNPDPASFEEDLLCAVVACHKAQVPPSNLRLREIMKGYEWLLENPAVPERCGLSPSESKTARTFLVNLGRHLAQDQVKRAKEEEQPTESEAESEVNDALLKKARKITQGKKLFVLCFNRRAEAQQRIQQELGFTDVDWPDLDGGESISSMESHIRSADMTVVVVRYSRTHWKDARDIARKYGKHFVMATKGYGLTHLATAIIEQCRAGA